MVPTNDQLGGSSCVTRFSRSLTLCAALACQRRRLGAAAPPPQYGSPGVTLEQAKKAIEAAEAEAKKNGWLMAIAVVRHGGDLVHLQKMDNTQFASIEIAQHKAKAARDLPPADQGVRGRRRRRPGRVCAADARRRRSRRKAASRSWADGKIIGAIGCSGGTGAQDGQVCKAGVDAMK